MTTLGSSRHSRTPQGFRVAAKSYKAIEQVADGIRPLLPKAAGLQWKIDAARVLEQTLPRTEYQYRSMDKRVLEDFAGLTIPEQRVVLLREDVYDGLFEDNVFSRSTVIHELSHIVLEHAVTLHRGAPIGQHKFFEDSEWQANSLTAAIMMPPEAFKAARSMKELSRICGTSVQASTFRFERLVNAGLLNADHFGADKGGEEKMRHK